MDSNQNNLVEWYGAFTCNRYICLEFEHLDKSLYDFMKDRSFQRLLLKEIRPIVKEVANALDYLKAAGIIHADIKFENIILVNHAKEPYRLKVIDFGLAHEVSDADQGACIQSLPFRSPETLVGLPYTEAMDMWSLGCVAASLYLGCLLYPGSTEYDMTQRFSSKTTMDKCVESSDRILFGDLLCGMLEFDAAKRLSPRQVLQHQFSSMQDMVSRYHLSP
ncbi:Homeodomain-interacting protein kinase 1 [Liparis tanakae]|uniref:Homeodomain-interacting protein kinase 1 n=1 Tax=Liparis tanakae TaxID=230148 RepID=A0A4Z2HFZ7_9TELE|nr:Homeodomain-interacting protein kinase 1 [Liparis tanakae]